MHELTVASLKTQFCHQNSSSVQWGRFPHQQPHQLPFTCFFFFKKNIHSGLTVNNPLVEIHFENLKRKIVTAKNYQYGGKVLAVVLLLLKTVGDKTERLRSWSSLLLLGCWLETGKEIGPLQYWFLYTGSSHPPSFFASSYLCIQCIFLPELVLVSRSTDSRYGPDAWGC